MKTKDKKCYLLNASWDSYDLTSIFYKKCYWELDNSLLNNGVFKLLAGIKAGDCVLLATMSRSVAVGSYLGIVKKVDLKKKRIYINWINKNVSGVKIAIKNSFPIIGPIPLSSVTH